MSRPTIISASCGLGHLTDRRAAGDAAGAQHDDAIADVEHLWQFVGDEDDALALPRAAARRIVRRSATSLGARLEVGSSRISNSASRSTALRISTRCRRPSGRSAITRVGIEVEAEALAGLADARGHLVALQQAARVGPAEHHVLDDAHRLDQHEMLMDHRDARRHRVGGSMTAQRVSAKNDLARRPAAIMPNSTFIKVLLPEPFSPSRPRISPVRTSRSTPSLARTAPKQRTIPRISKSADINVS